MARQNTRTASTRRPARGPITTEAQSSGRTHQGGPGFAYDSRGELFLLATTNFVNEKTFYEQAQTRDNRYVNLIHQVAAEDPAWVAAMLRWLRGPGNMRTASVVGAAEYVRALHLHNQDRPTGPASARAVVDSVIKRADEPGEMLAYWINKYGRPIPISLRRGVGDAIIRLGTEFNYLKWDSESRGLRFTDVLNLVHPGDREGSRQEIRGDWQRALFGHAIAERYGTSEGIPAELGTLTKRQALMAMPVDERRSALEDPNLLKEAGMTWEALAGWLQGPMDAAAWQAIIPSMGYMALLRNLRNFEQAGVAEWACQKVCDRLMDAEEVARSRQLPMRFFSAHREVANLRWGYPLEVALGHSLGNIPALPGRTLVLVDTSSSMNQTFSEKTTLKRWDMASLFGLALGSRCASADVVSYSSAQTYMGDREGAKTKVWNPIKGESVLRSLDRWKAEGYNLGGGTDTSRAVTQHFNGHDRVVLLTDEQNGSRYEVGSDLPDKTFAFTANLAGYRMGHAPAGSGRRVTLAGLTDAMFTLIPRLEQGAVGAWPWETEQD